MFKPYPTTTMWMDRMGCIHVWKGDESPLIETGIYLSLARSDKRQSDVYFQMQEDVETALDYLPEDERDFLENGYTLVTNFFPDDYFSNY